MRVSMLRWSFFVFSICQYWIIINLSGIICCEADLEEKKYILIRDGDEEENELGGLFYKPLPCFGFGIGWLSWVSFFFYYYCLVFAWTSSRRFIWPTSLMLGFFLGSSSRLLGTLPHFYTSLTITVEIHARDLVLLPLLLLWVSLSLSHTHILSWSAVIKGIGYKTVHFSQALIFTVALLITVLVLLFSGR